MYWLTIVFAVSFLVFYFHCTSDGKFHDPFFFRKDSLWLALLIYLKS